MNNFIDVNLSPETKESVLQAIVNTKLAMPFLIKLSDNDRKSLQMMDDGRKPFVEKSIDIALRNPSLDPGSQAIVDQLSKLYKQNSSSTKSEEVK